MRFKGVVLQRNGRWGAQIYEGQQRVWLGSFADEESAARAYDVAALRYRGWGAATNFPAADVRRQLAFLAARRRSEVVDMLRNQTYADELRRHGVPAPPPWAKVPLFEKNVTASDVGKLNRLVVPKRHAERHLPPVRRQGAIAGGGRKGCVMLAVEDREAGKVWRFRYSYWESSQTYVLTKGWILFVQEKGLRAGDTVAFSKWAFGPDEQLLIDYRKKKPRKKKKKMMMEEEDKDNAATTVVKLFGVDIAVVGGREGGEGPQHMARSW
ncbi:hypothetical protein HU200_055433 [Digitaria exilis]|uniref:AP2/ERF and B3 domain-containing protein n=1 Tax=Digitaria exilis TaxID=1010633 RepID=A0A835E5L9_9POAL|nr:hypothetical protein HU200_055433 [Digitaria exilis]